MSLYPGGLRVSIDECNALQENPQAYRSRRLHQIPRRIPGRTSAEEVITATYTIGYYFNKYRAMTSF